MILETENTSSDLMENKIIESFGAIFMEIAPESWEDNQKITKFNESSGVEKYSSKFDNALLEVAEYFKNNDRAQNYFPVCINSIFFWKMSSIFFLSSEPNKQSAFQNLVLSGLPLSKLSIEERLVLREIKEVHNILCECSNLSDEVKIIVDEFLKLILQCSMVFNKVNPHASTGQAILVFMKKFEESRSKFCELESRLEREITELRSTSNERCINEAVIFLNCLKIRSGNKKYIIERFQQQPHVMLCAYMKFVDPFLRNTIEFIEFKKLFLVISNQNIAENPNIFVMFSIFENFHEAHVFLQSIGDKLPQWFVFHFGYMLFMKGLIHPKKRVEINGKSLTYDEFLGFHYLDYLSKKTISFDVFRTYYCIHFDFENNYNQEDLISYTYYNYRNDELLDFLKEHHFGWIISEVVDRFLTECKNERGFHMNTDYLRFLFFVDNSSCGKRLLNLMFDNLCLTETSEEHLSWLANICFDLKTKGEQSNNLFEEMNIFILCKLKAIRKGSRFEELLVFCQNHLQMLQGRSEYIVVMILKILLESGESLNLELMKGVQKKMIHDLIWEYRKVRSKLNENERRRICKNVDEKIGELFSKLI